jgi:hypothetical protein
MARSEGFGWPQNVLPAAILGGGMATIQFRNIPIIFLALKTLSTKQNTLLLCCIFIEDNRLNISAYKYYLYKNGILYIMF